MEKKQTTTTTENATSSSTKEGLDGQTVVTVSKPIFFRRCCAVRFLVTGVDVRLWWIVAAENVFYGLEEDEYVTRRHPGIFVRTWCSFPVVCVTHPFFSLELRFSE